MATALPFYAYGKRGYGAIIRETTAGTAVKPTKYFYFESEKIASPWEVEYISPVASTRNKTALAVPGKNAAPTGQITMQVQADVIGQFLAGAFGYTAATNTSGPTDTTAYTHTFSSAASGTIPTYTVDIANVDALYVKRYYGCRFGKLKFYRPANVWMMDVELMARGMFQMAKIATTVSSGTTIVLDSNVGLTVGDAITASFGTTSTTSEALTVATVNVDGVTITVSETIAKTHTAGEFVTIAKSAPSYPTSTTVFQWMGGTTTKIGATIGAASAVQRLYDFSVDVAQDLVPAYAPNGTSEASRFPYDVLVAGYGSTMTTRFHHQDLTYLGYLRDRTPVAFDVIATGSTVAGAATTKDTFEIMVSKFQLAPHDVALGPDGIIEEAITGTCLPDSSAGYDVQIKLINAIANYTT